MIDLTCMGLTTLDILARPIDALPTNEQTALVEEITMLPAGTAGGTALIAAKLGLNAALISAAGGDLNGKIVQSFLSESKVDIQHVTTAKEMPTSTTILAINSKGERPNFHMMGASLLTEWTPEALATAKASKVFHFAGVGFPNLSGGDSIEALRALQKAGVKVTCDLIAPQPNTLDILKQFLPYIDVFMPSRAEVNVLLGDIDLEDALGRFVSLGAKNCFIKLGGEGVIGLVDDKIVRLPAHDITPVDTTSCGDAFCAGVIAGLVNDVSLETAAKYGNATASFVAQGLGTLGKLESLDSVLEIAKGS